MCETCRLPTAPNRQPPFRARSQRAARADAKLAVSRIRHNPTESNTIRRKLVCARDARTRARQRRSVSLLSAWIAPRAQRVGCIAWSCPPIAVMPIVRTEASYPLA